MKVWRGMWVGLVGVVLAGMGLAAAQTTSGPAKEAETQPSTRPTATQPRNDVEGLGNFAQVSKELYRGAQPTAEGFKELKKMGIKTVVDLRSLHSDKELMKGLGLRYVSIPAKAWHPEDGDMEKFLKVVSDPANQPVFVHCQAGADRTGYAVGTYRKVYQGWTAEEAVAELPRFGYHTIFGEVKTYLQELDAGKMKGRVEKMEGVKVEVVE